MNNRAIIMIVQCKRKVLYPGIIQVLVDLKNKQKYCSIANYVMPCALQENQERVLYFESNLEREREYYFSRVLSLDYAMGKLFTHQMGSP